MLNRHEVMGRLVKMGEIEPMRCGHCEWCKSTKILTEPTIYEVE